MTLLSKSDILAVDDLPTEEVKVPEWGGTVRVRGMSGIERDAYEASQVAMRQAGKPPELRLANFRSKLIVRCLIDDAGKRLFADTDAAELGRKSGKVVDRLFDVCRKLSGMTDEAVAEAEGNS